METKCDVTSLRDLLGNDVLLLHCKCGEKKPVGRWKHLTAEAMKDPAYLARLGRGNVGVALGARSGGLCSLDIDSDGELQGFMQANQEIGQTLVTRGARGGNLWWRLRGPFPALSPLKRQGNAWGEWRADGAQTIICGRHPTGVSYGFLQRRPPLRIAFDQILWPAGVDAPSLPLVAGSDTERPEPAERTERTEPTERTVADSRLMPNCSPNSLIRFSTSARP